MPDAQTLRHIQDVSRLIEARLGLKGPTIQAQMSKLGRRRLPTTLRRDIAGVAQAQLMLTHPKLSRQIDTARVAQSARLATAALKQIDPWEQRKTIILRKLAKWSALAIALFIGFVWWLWATGRV
ncbi:hypothetical protein AN189_11710 [Loktanella sp. 3ANDIMAR09]|uniref:hypothetical protein n=1 Tax=Loktanella sp. 3ANDIMAR09 TaxID=1225657 RepID=UPI0006FB9DFE|nr:hypothetical protein [Loktanella sp. 3ANDIMAR09]KQI68078.1 hypothetical protein AN189_11710 [Loktanella sp. 3ANDIMAR09]